MSHFLINNARALAERLKGTEKVSREQVAQILDCSAECMENNESIVMGLHDALTESRARVAELEQENAGLKRTVALSNKLSEMGC